jgi:hypothetical protein
MRSHAHVGLPPTHPPTVKISVMLRLRSYTIATATPQLLYEAACPWLMLICSEVLQVEVAFPKRVLPCRHRFHWSVVITCANAVPLVTTAKAH